MHRWLAVCIVFLVGVLSTPVLAQGSIAFDSTRFVAYSGNQDGWNGSYTDIRANGGGIRLEGNAWKAFPYDYTVTEHTILRFDVRITDLGEVHGIGVDTDLAFNTGDVFYLQGTQSVTQFHMDYAGSYETWTTVTIPVGQYRTGDTHYLVFINDDDTDANAATRYRNLALYEDVTPTATPTPTTFTPIPFTPTPTTSVPTPTPKPTVVAPELDGDILPAMQQIANETTTISTTPTGMITLGVVLLIVMFEVLWIFVIRRSS